MKIIRSWPLQVPEDHPRVEDNAERCYIPTIDYVSIAEYNEDLIQLDWDVAVGRTELREFAAKCTREPDRVRTAPICQYPTRMWKDHMWRGGTRTQWCVWRWDEGQRIELKPGDPFCHISAFGLVYLPAKWNKLFVQENPGLNFNDVSFCEWYCSSQYCMIPVEWDTHAIHINYTINDALTGPD